MSISRFFPSPSSGKKRAAPETIDLTLSDDDDTLTAKPALQKAKRVRTTSVSTATSISELPPAGKRQRKDRKRTSSNNKKALDHSPPRAPIEEFTTSPVGSDTDSGPSTPSSSKLTARKRPLQRKTSSPHKVRPGPSGEPYTPLEEQVLKFKEDNPGTLLMFEIGYKYIFYQEDAEVAARVLGIQCFPKRNLRMAFIPVENREKHLRNLLSQGHRVGIVQQAETAALKKAGDNRSGLFKRVLAHLYTSTTYVDELASVDDTERYTSPPLMCVLESKSTHSNTSVALSVIIVCPHTGDVTWDHFEDGEMRIELETRLTHAKPAELLLPTELSAITKKLLTHFANSLPNGKICPIEYLTDKMDYTEASEYVHQFYARKTGRLLADIVGFPSQVVIALAQTIKHLDAFGVADALLETEFFTRFTDRTHMLLTANTITNLELYRNETDYTTKGSLVSLLDRTKTKFGARLLRSWVGRPLIDKKALQARVDAVEELKTTTSPLLQTLQDTLSKLPDLAKGLSRIQYGQCTPKELAELLRAFQKVGSTFDPGHSSDEAGFRSKVLSDIILALPEVKRPIEGIVSQIDLKATANGEKESMWVSADKFPLLENAIVDLQNNDIELNAELKSVRKSLRSPALSWVTVAGIEYLVQIKKSDQISIPDNWVVESSTKDYKRYHTPTTKRLISERAQYTETIKLEADKAYRSFLKDIARDHYNVLRHTVNKLATADCLLSLTKVALEHDYVRPEFLDDSSLQLVGGRHPMIESLSHDPFVANSIDMGQLQPKSKIITGPNMGGKSSCVRMVALLAIMAQIGSYVPAESLKLGLVDAIFTRMGASDELARGRSTFMVEMSETSEILKQATSKSIVILDELGRGTSTFDGIAIASAVLEQLVEGVDARTLFITHYPTIAEEFETRYPDKVQNLHMGYTAEARIDGIKNVTFLYKLTDGLTQESFGVECGQLAGLPDAILQQAVAQAAKLRVDVEKRRVRRALQLIKQCTDSTGVFRGAEIKQLSKMMQKVKMTIQPNI